MKNQTQFNILLLTIALIQGLLLLGLHLALEHHFWPHENPAWLTSFYTMALGGPLLLLLSLTRENIKKDFIWVGAFTGIAGLLGYYVGTQAIPFDILRVEGLFFAYGVTMAIAGFKFLMYSQQYASDLPLTYSNLYRFSWRNFLSLGLSGLFTGIFWAILMLWAALFKLIKIDFFFDLFTNEWFFYPVVTMVNAFGLIVLREQTNVIDVLTRIQQALMKYLLLILILVSIIFIATLPFTGLSALWATKSGSFILLWMQAMMLFFLNAVYQDEVDQRLYGVFLHRFVTTGIALLPIFSAIIFYGLSLRISQYGWTVGRSWGVLIAAIFALFSLGYLWGMVKKRDDWVESLSWVNIRMGLMVLATMLLVNSPLLDFRKISVASQMARLESREVSYDDFDYYYFKINLAAPGYEALQALKDEIQDSHPKIITKIDSWYPKKNSSLLPPAITSEDSLIVWPKGEKLPEDLVDALKSFQKDRGWFFQRENTPYILVVDLNDDGAKEYLLLSLGTYTPNGQLFSVSDNKWQNHRVIFSKDWDLAQSLNALKKGTIEIVPASWNDLKIGDGTIRVVP